MRSQLRLTQENARGQDCEAELLRVTAELLNNFFAYSINRSAWLAKNPFVLPMLEQSFALSGNDAERAVGTFLTDFGVDHFGTTSMETRSFKYEVLERLVSVVVFSCACICACVCARVRLCVWA